MNSNIKLTANFSYIEFWSNSKTGIKVEPPQSLFNYIYLVATELQKLRDIIKRPIIINSGYRTAEWNKLNGGVKSSFHLKGMACDTRPVGMTIKDYLHYLLRYTNFNGIGINVAKNFIHADTRDKFTIIHY